MFFDKSKIENRPLVLNLIATFYTLMEMRDMLGNQYMSFIHSAHILDEEIKEYQSMFNSQLAQMIKDYTMKVIFGEARYTPYRATLADRANDYYFFLLEDGRKVGTRDIYNEVIKTTKYYTRESIIKFAMTCFDPSVFCWEENYGGNAWFNIAKSLTFLQEKNQEKIYIDHAFDLQHNSGVYLDKGADIFDKSMDGVRDLLDFKVYANVFQLIDKYGCHLDEITLGLAYRFLQIMKAHLYSMWKHFDSQGIYTYEEYRWGVPFIGMISTAKDRLNSRIKLRKNNTHIYWLERYEPMKFGYKDATKLIYIPPIKDIENPFICTRDDKEEMKYGAEHHVFRYTWKAY